MSKTKAKEISVEIPILEDYSDLSMREFSLQFVLKVLSLSSDTNYTIPHIIYSASLVEEYLRNGLDLEEDDSENNSSSLDKRTKD